MLINAFQYFKLSISSKPFLHIIHMKIKDRSKIIEKLNILYNRYSTFLEVFIVVI